MIASAVLRTIQALLAVGAVFQLALRDHVEALVGLFHVLPLPVLSALALFAALFSQVLRRRRTWVCWLACAAFLGTWFARSWCWGPASPPPSTAQADELRVLTWNIGRPQAPSLALVRMIQELDPHIIVVIEPGREAGSHLPAYERELPGYKADWMPRGITWLSRLPSRYRHRGKLDGTGAYAVFEVEWAGRKIPVVAVDVYGPPFHSRRNQIRESLAHTKDDPRALLMGDFNTPAGSVCFLPLREHMQDAFEAAGRGFRETWFWGLPVLTLDYIWAGSAWEVVETRKIQVGASDHAALFSRVRLREEH